MRRHQITDETLERSDIQQQKKSKLNACSLMNKSHRSVLIDIAHYLLEHL